VAAAMRVRGAEIFLVKFLVACMDSPFLATSKTTANTVNHGTGIRCCALIRRFFRNATGAMSLINFRCNGP
jgi:hypothetical protein